MYQKPIGYKEPGIAAVLSAVIVGLGQIYNGQIGKGIGMMVITAFFGLLTLVLIGWLFLPIIWLWAIIDAYKSAQAINDRLARQAPTATPPPPTSGLV